MEMVFKFVEYGVIFIGCPQINAFVAVDVIWHLDCHDYFGCCSIIHELGVKPINDKQNRYFTRAA